jgi:hypothetical protein
MKLRFDKKSYQPNELMTLTVVESLVGRRRIRVVDSSGAVWQRVHKEPTRMVFTARAGAGGTPVVTATMTRKRDGAVFVERARYDVAPAKGAPVAGALAMIGMSAPASIWKQRLAEVGPHVTARRIFADLRQGHTSQIRLIEEAHAAGMMPVISYKVGGDAAGAAAGKFNATAEKAAALLASYKLPTTVTYWHEPHGNMAPGVFVNGNKQLLPIFKRGDVTVGPLLNGWLLDRNVSTFASYCPDELFDIWDWFGIDTYESGTMEAPGSVKPAHRIPKLVDFVKSRGFDHPLGIGEYNGYSATTIAAAGEAILSTPQVKFGCMWNSTAGKGYALSGSRLNAFKETLADSRTRKS